MDQYETRPPVLARIPDLGRGRCRSANWTQRLSPKGRILSQPMSVKLLAAAALLLVAVAIVPIRPGKTTQPADVSAVAAAAPAPTPSTPAPQPEIAVPVIVPPPGVVALPATSDETLVAARAVPASAPAAVPADPASGAASPAPVEAAQPIAATVLPPAVASDAAADASAWPNRAAPVVACGQESPATDDMANRPPEYQPSVRIQ